MKINYIDRLHWEWLGSDLGVTCSKVYTKITMHHVFLNKLPGNDNDNDNDNGCGTTYPIINFRHPHSPLACPALRHVALPITALNGT